MFLHFSIVISVINRRAVVLVEVYQESLAKGCRQPIAQLIAMYCSLSNTQGNNDSGELKQQLI